MTGRIVEGDGLVISIDGVDAEQVVADECVVVINGRAAEVGDLEVGDLVTCTRANVDDTYDQHVVSIVAQRDRRGVAVPVGE
jgi:hypothetical protein